MKTRDAIIISTSLIISGALFTYNTSFKKPTDLLPPATTFVETTVVETTIPYVAPKKKKKPTTTTSSLPLVSSTTTIYVAPVPITIAPTTTIPRRTQKERDEQDD